MSESTPTLLPDPQDLWQRAQAVIAITGLVQSIRARRERDGRLRHAEDAHAALQHEIRQHPPVRLMSEDEQREWQQRIPAALAAQPGDDPVSVWTAQMVDEHGSSTDEWGVEVHTWSPAGGATSTAFVVCRDAEDALAMAQHLREHGTPESVGQVHDLAALGRGRYAVQPQAARLGGYSAPLVLSEQDWETALRRELPPELANRVIVKDSAHPHHRSWQKLHELANQEVLRVGADPGLLAKWVHSVPRWHDSAINPPALGHWAIKESRTSSAYVRAVTGNAADAEAAAPKAAANKMAEGAARVRLPDVRSPDEALAWANGLDAGDRGHRLEAKAGFGHWGDEIDGLLNAKFPGLAQNRIATATGKRTARSGKATADAAETVIASEPDPATLRSLAERIGELDPAKPMNRLEALTMFGHVPPEIDRLIWEKFPDDPRIVDKVQERYPDGLPEANAVAWRNRADSAEAAAATQLDDPSTPQREDLDAAAASRGERALAGTQQGIARTLVGAQPPVLRRTAQPQPAPETRRTRH